MRRKYKCALVLVIVLICAGTGHAVLRNGNIEGKAGLSYGFMAYSFGSVDVTVMNRNGHNVTFGGTMIFLDKNYRVVAKAELLNGTITRRSSRKYKAFFSEGNGETAKNAKYVRWEF